MKFCLHDMFDEYRVFLENLSFLSFSRLMEAERRTNESVRRTSKSNIASRPGPVTRIPPPPRKRLTVVAVEKGQGSGPSNQPAYMLEYRPKHRQECKASPILSPFLYGLKKAITLLG